MVFNNNPLSGGVSSFSGLASPHDMLLSSRESQVKKGDNTAEQTLASLDLTLGNALNLDLNFSFDPSNETLYSDAFFGQSALGGANVSLAWSQSKNPALEYLEPHEIQLLDQLPEHHASQILDIHASPLAEDGHQQLINNAKQLIHTIMGSQNIHLDTKGGAEWELSSLLGIIKSLNRLPITQRLQMDGLHFVRAPRPANAEGSKDSLITQVALQSIAGEYVVHEKSVYIYDRGITDELPTLSNELKQSLRSMESQNYSKTVEELQTMLNPYLQGMGHAPIPTDGLWSKNTERAVRIVQAELLSRHLKGSALNADQNKALASIRSLSASPQFDMMSRVTNLKGQMQSLNMLPDPHMRQLLEEFSRSDFGEASLRALMQDIARDVRSNPNVTRVEEVVLHETGHHFQLGLDNEAHYIAEFAKLSNWREKDGKAADGYVQGKFAPEDLMDVYNIMASDGAVDAGKYTIGLDAEARSQNFVSTYASTDPMEDFAESYKAFVLEPEKLMAHSPRKFFFINALPAIQSRRTGAGARQHSHYQPEEIKRMAKQVLVQRYDVVPTDAHVNQFLRSEMEDLMGLTRSDGRQSTHFGLHPDVVLATIETHRGLMDAIKMPYVSHDRLYQHLQQNDPDYQVFRMIHLNTQSQIQSNGNNERADVFFQRFQDPREVDHLFPLASEGLRERLKDPAFSSMMLVLGQIGGHASYINSMQNEELSEVKSYEAAKEFLDLAKKEPTSLFSLKAMDHGYNYLRGKVNSWFDYNPEVSQMNRSMQFLQQLEDNPRGAFPEIWDKLPQDFRDLLGNKRFIQSVSGDKGRYLPSAAAVRNTLENVMEMVEYERGFQALLNAAQ